MKRIIIKARRRVIFSLLERIGHRNSREGMLVGRNQEHLKSFWLILTTKVYLSQGFLLLCNPHLIFQLKATLGKEISAL